MKYQRNIVCYLFTLLLLICMSGCTLNEPPYTIKPDGTYVYRDSGIKEEPVQTMLLPGVTNSAGKEVSLLLIKFVPPHYPDNLKAQGIQGEVQLRFQITDEGKVEKLEVIAANPADIFNFAATSAVKQWKFKPGEYLETYILTISFEL